MTNFSVKTYNISSISIPRLDVLISLAERILSNERKGNINLIFCGNEFIRNLNTQFRKKDTATDVLSFDYSEPDIMGEIYISTPKAKEQAAEYQTTFYMELKRLVTHGCLHLAGFDHHKPKDTVIMEAKEQFYLA